MSENTVNNSNQKIWTDHSVTVFLILVIVGSAITEALYIINPGNGMKMLLLMWIPGISALIANIITLVEKHEKLTIRQFLNRLGFRNAKRGYILLGVLIPLVYLLIPYMVYWKLYPENYGYHGVPLFTVLKDTVPVLTIGLVFSLGSALGEELGWRGFMVPSLQERIGLKKTLLITSLFWACWHLPLLIWGGYMDQAPLWYRLPAFVVCIMPIGIVCGLLAVDGHSVWPSAFLHAAHNNYDQNVFAIITRGGKLMYYVSETGFLTIICAWIIAIIMLVMRSRKQRAENKPNKGE